MGCSASRPSSFHGKTFTDDPPFSDYSSPYAFSPVTGAVSLPTTTLVHHPPLRKGDTHHLVSLTSTTYGSLLLADRKNSPPRGSGARIPADTRDPLSPDSVINTWELMDGLDDFDVDGGDGLKLKAATFHRPVASGKSPMKPSSFREMGSDGSAEKLPGTAADDSPPFSVKLKAATVGRRMASGAAAEKPTSFREMGSNGSAEKLPGAAADDSPPLSLKLKAATFGRLVASGAAAEKPSSFREMGSDGSAEKLPGAAADKLKAATFHRQAASGASPEKPSSFREVGSDGSAKKPSGAAADDSPPLSKPLWKHLSEEALLAKMDPNVAASYRRALSSRQLNYDHSKTAKPDPLSFRKPEKDTKIVVYFTSLRGIRKTYEDCCSVRMIFRGFRVRVDERDISMDSAYKIELQELLGRKGATLPQVFIGGNHIGGADEIRQLNELGELANLLEGLPVRDPGYVCKTCGDARFVPCPNCCGSRKIFEEYDGQLRRCLGCNENGLIRCPGCCS